MPAKRMFKAAQVEEIAVRIKALPPAPEPERMLDREETLAKLRPAIAAALRNRVPLEAVRELLLSEGMKVSLKALKELPVSSRNEEVERGKRTPRARRTGGSVPSSAEQRKQESTVPGTAPSSPSASGSFVPDEDME